MPVCLCLQGEASENESDTARAKKEEEEPSFCADKICISIAAVMDCGFNSSSGTRV